MIVIPRTDRSGIYLRSLFSGLKPDDVIITLNWDTTARENTCRRGSLVSDRWLRLPKRKSARVKSRSGDGPKKYPVKSEVTVLKNFTVWSRLEQRRVLTRPDLPFECVPIAGVTGQPRRGGLVLRGERFRAARATSRLRRATT